MKAKFLVDYRGRETGENLVRAGTVVEVDDVEDSAFWPVVAGLAVQVEDTEAETAPAEPEPVKPKTVRSKGGKGSHK
ncbi:MAG: hypothetical protein AAGU05_01120 [Anaerolineaceae bacterium]